MQRLSLLAASILFLTACGTPVATATIQPSPTPTRTPAPSPSPTLAPTFTPTATSTPFPTPIVRDAYINAELGLNLRLGPSLETDLIDTLSYGTHLTRFDPPTEPDADGYAWQNVQTDDGQSGWVVIEWLTDTQPDVLVFNPFTPFTIETLRERAYSQGPIEIVGTLQETAAFTRYVIAYPSDGLRVTAMMNIPLGGAPDERFPVIILNHGFVDPGRFPTGSYIRAEADYLARQGYLTFSPDYRGHSGGEGDPELAGPSVRGENSFRVEYAVDVLSLLHAIPTIPQADPTRIGMWGHSMGGGITLKVLSVDRGKQVDAAVLYGAMSGDETRNLRHIDKLWQPGIYDQVTAVFGTPEEKPEAYALISPLTYVADIAVPVGIHHGTLDDQVPIEWSQELAQQLEAAGKAVELFEYDKAGHSFSGETWIAFMQRVTAFFDQYVKAATE